MNVIFAPRGAIVAEIPLEKLHALQKAVSDRLMGGSITAVLLILAGIVGAVLLVHLLSRRQERSSRTLLRNDPHLLFVRLIDKLKLPALQREALGDLAKAAQLGHPAVLLLSPDAFDRSVAQWEKSRPQEATGNQRAVIGAARARLFPN